MRGGSVGCMPCCRLDDLEPQAAPVLPAAAAMAPAFTTLPAAGLTIASLTILHCFLGL